MKTIFNVALTSNKDRAGIIGKTGEPFDLLDCRRGQRVHSTRLLERDLATEKRSVDAVCMFTTKCDNSLPTKAARKGPKYTSNLDVEVSHLNSLNSCNVGSGETLGKSKQLYDSKHLLTCEKRMQTLWKNSSKPGFIAYGLWKLCGNIELWIAAYKKLAPNPGSMTEGGAKGNIDGTSLKTLQTLRDSIINEKFKFGTTRRTYIPKPKGGVRQLGIPEFQDRLVQEVIRTILESVFEPSFTESSHGFRPNRSQHTSLRQIRRDFKGVKWYIEGDVNKCFDEINHEKLLLSIRKRVKDHKFISLISKGLQSRVILPSGKTETLNKGTPQGSIISPLLSNIALHELDLFLERLMKIINRGKSRKINPKYQRQRTIRRTLIRRGDVRGAKKALKAARKIRYGDPTDITFRKLVYTRYADDFLIGIIGPRSLAIKCRSLICLFLKKKLWLTLNVDKTVITRAHAHKIPFLGYLVSHSPIKGWSSHRKSRGGIRKIRVHRGGDIHLYVDTNKIIKRFSEKGFCDKAGNSKPNFNYLHDPQSFTVSRISSLLVGLSSYYKLADNRRHSVSRLVSILRGSLARLFAAKFKLGTQRQVYKIAGKNLAKPILKSAINVARGNKKKVSPIGGTDEQLKIWANQHGGKLQGKFPFIPFTKYREISQPDKRPLSASTMKWEKHYPDPLRKLLWRSKRGRTSLQGTCAKCGEINAIEMHHVRKLSDLTNKNDIEVMMIAARRKQIPLCKSCHLSIHGSRQRGLKKNSTIAL